MLAKVAALTPAQDNTLKALSRAVKPMTVAQIAGEQALHANTVRETLDALVKAGLVHRERVQPVGRGRPSWAYEAVVPASMDTFGNQLMHLANAVAAYVCEQDGDYRAQCAQIGRTWAAQVLAGARIPDHSGNDHEAEARRLSVHVSKVRIFLSSLGYAALAVTDDEWSFELMHCPVLSYLHDPQASEVQRAVGYLHKGLIDGILETTSGGRVVALISATDRAGVSRISLRPNL